LYINLIAALAIEGTVDCRGDVQPASIDSQYSQLCRKRTELASKRSFTKTTEGNFNIAVKPVTGAKSSLPYIKPKNDPKQEHNFRMNRDELTDLLFVAFGTRSNWDFKGFHQHTKQPKAYLKEILGELCVYHKGGPNQYTYELKPEFRVRNQ